MGSLSWSRVGGGISPTRKAQEGLQMIKPPSFGFSAFLKLLNIKDAPQKTEVRKRYKPSKGGYDYHKNLRKRIQWLATGSYTMATVLATLDQIKKKPERNATERALRKFGGWRELNPQDLLPSLSMKMKSPNEAYNVIFTADFVVKLGSRQTAVHVWNTQCKLSRDITLALLTQIASAWPISKARPHDFAVLSLQTGEMYRWSEASREHSELGLALLKHIDRLCEIALRDADGDAAEERPSPRPI